MTSTFLKLRNHKTIKTSFTSLVFLWGITGTVLAIFRAAFADFPLAYFIITITYFTTQSNLLITLVALLLFLGYSNRKWFHYLSFIVLINSIMTGLVFHTLLAPYINNVSFLQQVLHTINPILYMLLFFVFLDYKLEYKKFWIALIYPLLYLALVYLFMEPVFGSYLEQRLPLYPSVRYVYPFLNPNNYPSRTVGLVGFITGILTPIICLISLLLIFFKRKIEKKITLLKV